MFINEIDKHFDERFRDVNEGYGYMPTFDSFNPPVHPTTSEIRVHAFTKEALNEMFDGIRFYPPTSPLFGISIKNVRFSPPATIVFWSDNTKTVVKAQNGEPFDAEKGLMACIIKRITGNTGRYNELFKKYIKEDK